MEAKKNKNADINRVRSSFFMVGFCYISGLVLAAFTYQDIVDEDGPKKLNTGSGNTTTEEVNKDEPPKEEPPKPIEQPQPQQEIDLTQEIEVVENNNEEQKETIIETIEIVEEQVEVTEIVEPVVDFPDVEAEFTGGESAMQKWMQQNLVYPEMSMEMGEQGKVYLKFVVEKDGTISNVEVIKGVSRDLDNEAKRLVRAMPGWKAGESKGMKVRSSFTMPINFELN
ncbi:MAG: energy transducer TonB [Crocinitomicaceae bacterium]